MPEDTVVDTVDQNTTLDDGMTAAERAYFETGQVSDALLNENKDAPEATPAATETPATLVAPAGETAPEPSQTEDAGDEPGAAGQPPKRVGWKKYEAELTARQALEKQVQEQAVKNARVEERLALLQQALQEPQQQPAATEEMPDPDKDIFGAFRWLVDRHNSMQEKITAYEQQIVTGQQEMEEERKYINSMEVYAGKEPHFVDAYNFLLRNRAAELMAPRYPGATFEQLMQAEIPDEIGQLLRQEERALYKEAFENQISPAAQIFRMAQLRGFRPQAPQVPQTLAGTSQTPGTPLGKAPGTTQSAPAATPSVAAQVEAVKKGQAAAASLSNVSGSAGAPELTPEALANMSDDDFANFFNRLQESGNKEKLKQFFGA